MYLLFISLHMILWQSWLHFVRPTRSHPSDQDMVYVVGREEVLKAHMNICDTSHMQAAVPEAQSPEREGEVCLLLHERL